MILFSSTYKCDNPNGIQTNQIQSYNSTTRKNKANTYKSRAKLTDLEWLRMPGNDLELLKMT